MKRVAVVGLDEPEFLDLRGRLSVPALFHPLLPKLEVADGGMYVSRGIGSSGLISASHVVFHGIFADDLPFITGLALWGGPCWPSAQGLLDCRERLPCLARALRHPRFGGMARGWAAGSQPLRYADPAEAVRERVAKWGNWHCGENKLRFAGDGAAVTLPEDAVIEPFIPGESVRIAKIGDRMWQIRMSGEGWLKSIHHGGAYIEDHLDADLAADTARLGAGLGLEILGVDYQVDQAGRPWLLEVNHAPNVTIFPEIREAFLLEAAAWVERTG